MDVPTVGFLFIGGEHQMLHVAPVAARLARDEQVRVEAFVATEAEAAALVELTTALGTRITPHQLELPAWGRLGAWLSGSSSTFKTPRLIGARERLASFDALVVAERTSTVLKRLPGTKPYMIHIPHGAGDRAKGFERRIASFDHVIVAGHKDRNRMIAERLVQPEDCSVSGYIKRDAVRALAQARTRLFENDRPVVLYNPHFSPDLTSWPMFGAALMTAFAAQDDYNLVLAPHSRLASTLSGEARDGLRAQAIPGRIIVDPESPRCYDMTYTKACDIYVGDVSSQVYEALDRPKPCVFLNRGVAGWVNDPNYAFWRFGEVIDDPREVLEAVRRATGLHNRYADLQIQAVDAAFGPADADAIGVAAAIVVRLATARRKARDAD